MKIYKLFSLACAALMMSACASDNDENGGTKPNSEPQYLAVNIVNVGATPTRAGDYEDGTTAENIINKVRFYFFNSDGSPYLIKKPGNSNVEGGGTVNWLEASPSEDTSTSGTPSHVEKITEAVLVINGVQDAAPAAIVAVVNPETVDATTLKNGESMRLSEIRTSSTGTTFYKKDASGVSNFVMSNSVYVNAGEDVCSSLVLGHVATSAKDAMANPVDLYVERVVAKVTTDVDNTVFEKGDGTKWDKDKYGTKTAVGKIGENDVYAVIEGWGLADENGKAEIEKQVNKTWSEGNLGIDTWNTSDYKRCFWEKSVAFAAGTGTLGNLPVNHKYSELNAKMQDVLYTLPNTPEKKVTDYFNNNNLTKFIVAATLKYKDATGNWHIAEICRYNGVQILGIDNLKKQVVKTFSQYYTSTDGKTYTQLSESDIDFKDPDGTMKQYNVTPTLAADKAGTKKYYTKTSGTTPSYTQVDKAKVLADIETDKAEIRKEGKAYYYVPIKHLGKTGELGEYGIVRNHYYKITLSGIKGFGTPVYNPETVIIPVVPTYDNTYLAARVQVLQWRVVNQNASLGK